MDNIEIEVILPEQSDNELSDGLIKLTEAIDEIASEEVSHGILGGTFGYGAEYENDTFMMHPFCWCEADNCKWCNGEAPNFLHKPSGFSVKWYKYIGRSMEESGNMPEVQVMIDECIASIYTPEAIKALRKKQKYELSEIRYNAFTNQAIEEMLDNMGVPHTCDDIPLSAAGRLGFLRSFKEWKALELALVERNKRVENPDNYQSESRS